MTRDLQRPIALTAGLLLTALGLVGFFDSTFLGLGLNPLHNLIHLLSGVVALWAYAKGWGQTCNQWLGIIYLLLGVVGLAAGGFMASLLNATVTAHWFHLILGAVLALVGFTLKTPKPQAS